MSISLSTLTNPATSDSVLLEAQSEADFLEPIVLFKNRATGSNAISNDPTQTTANDQPLSLPLIDGDGYLYLSGVSGNNARIADSDSLTFLNDIEIIVNFKVLDDSTWRTLVSKYQSSEKEYLLTVSNTDNVQLYRGGGGSSAFFVNFNTSYADLKPWIKATHRLSDGRCQLFFSSDGITWNLFETLTMSAVTPSNSSTHFFIGGFGSAGQSDVCKGAIKKVIIKDGIDGTEQLNIDFTATSIADGASSFDCSTGQTVTINTGSGVDQARIVRRPKAVFNNSEIDFVHTNVGDAFFVCATESGVVSGVFDTGTTRNNFSGNGALKTSYRTDFLQTVWGMWPNTISDSQKKALVDYAKSKSAGKNWAGIENFRFFFRSSNLKSLDASYWDTGSATNFSYFLRGANTTESLDIRGWDTSSVVTMNDFARGCTSLTNILIDGNTLSDSACTNYGHAFTDTNLNQATIDDILVRINAAGTSNGTFGRTGGEYPSTTGVAAKNALQARGWSMTFSSEVLPSVLDLEPAAAYSLRALKSSEDPNVVRVRRSSDGALSNFKASEVTDGTLTTWVNTEYNKYTSDFSSSVDGWSSDGGNSYDFNQSVAGVTQALKITNVSNNYGYKAVGAVNGLSYRFTAKVYIPSSNTSLNALKFRFGYAPTNEWMTDSINTLDQWVTVTVNSYTNPMTSGAEKLYWYHDSSATSGDVFYLKDVEVTQLTADGHVTTWYDQGGTNHASQTLVSKMPKLVDAGTLVTEGGLAALDFGLESDSLSLNVLASCDVASIFTVTKPNTSSGNPLLGASGDKYIDVEADTLAYRVTNFDALPFENDFTQQLAVLIREDGAGTQPVHGYRNGVVSTEDPCDTNQELLTGNVSIGRRATADYYDGTIQEIVIYDTDQSANRTGIENNINDHFDIYS